MGGGDPFLKISVPYLIRFGCEGGLKIFWENGHLFIHLISNMGDCQASQATLGQLNIMS